MSRVIVRCMFLPFISLQLYSKGWGGNFKNYKGDTGKTILQPTASKLRTLRKFLQIRTLYIISSTYVFASIYVYSIDRKLYHWNVRLNSVYKISSVIYAYEDKIFYKLIIISKINDLCANDTLVTYVFFFFRRT